MPLSREGDEIKEQRKGDSESDGALFCGSECEGSEKRKNLGIPPGFSTRGSTTETLNTENYLLFFYSSQR